VASFGGTQGEWSVHRSKAETKLELTVHAGETVDFIVDCLTNANADSYTWAPNVAFAPDAEASDLTPRTWNAKTGFDTPARNSVPLNRWEELAQVLLLSNELAFVD
jgi:hypothetical protein